MLVTLATNESVNAGTSKTFQYSCTSVQKVMIYVDDSAGAIADPLLSIQLGSRTIASGISGRALQGLGNLWSGYVANNNINFGVFDLGSHELFPGEQLSVTVGATSDATSGSILAVDVSAIVNEPVDAMPLRYTEYADKVFTAENVLTSMVYKNDGGSLKEDSQNVEVRTSLYSSAPSVISSCAYYSMKSYIADYGKFGILSNNTLPLSTTFNYAQTVANRILCVQAMPVSKSQLAQAKRNKDIARAVVG